MNGESVYVTDSKEDETPSLGDVQRGNDFLERRHASSEICAVDHGWPCGVRVWDLGLIMGLVERGLRRSARITRAPR